MKTNTYKWVVGIVIVVILATVIIIFGYPRANSSVTVGVILPLSGQYSSLGESIENAMKLSQSDLPAGEKVNLAFEDDQFDSKAALSAYHKLTDVDHADIVVSFVSPSVEVIKPEVNKTDQVMFILGDELSHDTDHVFQLMPQGAGLFSILGQEAAKRYSSIAVVYASDNNLFDTDHQSFLKGLPANIQADEFPVQSSSDMKTEAAKIIQTKDQAFTLFMPVETGIKLLKSLTNYPSQSRPQLICDPDIEISIQQYVSAIGPDLFDGCISTALADTKTAQFISMYKSAFNSDPQFGSDYGYDAVKIAGELSTMSPSSWLGFLNSDFHYSGMSGNISFDTTGTRPAQAEIDTFQNGKFIKVQ